MCIRDSVTALLTYLRNNAETDYYLIGLIQLIRELVEMTSGRRVDDELAVHWPEVACMGIN